MDVRKLVLTSFDPIDFFFVCFCSGPAVGAEVAERKQKCDLLIFKLNYCHLRDNVLFLFQIR